MSDLITRARKTWCESRFGTDFPSEWATPEHSHRQCPPEVVAALLDVVDKLDEMGARMSEGGAEAIRAEAAIARALANK